MIFLSAIVFLITVIIEAGAIQLFNSDFIALAMAAHFSSSLLCVYSYHLFYLRSLKDSNWPFYLFVFLLCFFVPLFGLFITATLVIMLYLLHTKKREYSEIMDTPINLREMKPITSRYGSSGAIIHLFNSEESPIDRTRALFVLAESQLSEVNKILYDLLPDTSDEIRLLSYNILDQQEDLIKKDIIQLLATLQQPHLTPKIQAKFEKNLAISYFELSYRHLILQELEEITLDKARVYALKAVEVLKHDANLWVLIGKIYQRLKNYPFAEEAFIKASEYHIAPSVVLPYLAEIKYRERDFAATKDYLDQSDLLMDIPCIAPVKRFWDT